MGVRAKEDGKSESRLVMRRIGVALLGKITPRESGQTSIRSFPTREPELPTSETRRMTAVETQAGAVPNKQIDWTTIDWRTVNQNVRRLQARIVKATQEGRWNRVRVLQRLLTHSFSARCLAVKRVTTNQGKKTPGVDGIIWDTPEKKATAVDELKARGYSPQPLKRVYIPKSDGRRRGLSIPVMKDRARQALHLLALDPIAETRADPNSYGFRIGRAPADAIDQAFRALCRKGSAEWILKCDIRSCFDRISHQWLLDNVPMDKQTLNKWLKAGFIEQGEWHQTEAGTPQGGTISPVLMNWTLDGLERVLSENPRFKKNTRPGNRTKVNLVRFADDVIVTGSSKELLDEVKPLIEGFLEVRGLELSPEKTKIVHISEGFDFLGQHIRKYGQGNLLTNPSQESFTSLLRRIRTLIGSNLHVAPGILIWMLNPILRGWANYHRHAASKQTFQKVDNAIFWSLWKWCRRRHPHKTRQWIKEKYFQTVGDRHWVFSGEMRLRGETRLIRLYSLGYTPIRRHTKIKGEANPYDPHWETYFEQRLDARTEGSLTGLRMLLFLWKEQQGRCPVCLERITKLTGWQTHHLIWKSHGGTDSASNLVLLHPRCHQEVHGQKLVVVKPRPEKGVGKA
jgi:RNA-directed DNA polymerase